MEEDGNKNDGIMLDKQRNNHIISERGITAWHRQQLPHNIHMTVFTGTHESCGAVIITQVHLSPTGQQSFHHVPSAMTDRQHQCRLPCLPHTHASLQYRPDSD